MSAADWNRGLTLLETVISLLLIGILMSILLPALSTARRSGYRDQCASNQRRISEAWTTYLRDHDYQFPSVPIQPGWHYGGFRFSRVDDSAFPDQQRPLTPYLPLQPNDSPGSNVCLCPADHGLTDPETGIGTGQRTAFRSFGTSYRANAPLLDARLAGISDTPRGMHRHEVTALSSRLVLMGDPVWYEAAETTGRNADWHGKPNTGNILFLDGSVRYRTVKPHSDRNQAIVFDPIKPESHPSPIPESEDVADEALIDTRLPDQSAAS